MKVHMKKLAAFMLAGALVLSGFGQTTVEAEESTPEEQGIEAVANENAAAKIGDTAYNTLADAIAAVKDGETITLARNVTDAKGMSVPGGKNFTVDFNGKIYTCLLYTSPSPRD